MQLFHVPDRAEVTARNQQLFDKLQKMLDRVPNLHATLAYSENALQTYLTLENSPSSLSKKQQAIINLAVSQVNNAAYCLSAYSFIATMNGFSPPEIDGFRAGAAVDPALDILARLTRRVTEQRGHIDPVLISEFFAAGYTREQLVDLIMVIGNRTISNLLQAVTELPVDYAPAAPLEFKQ